MDDAFGRYRLRELLGAGGMGQVYRAFDTELQRELAIKVLLPHVSADPAFAERIRREARLAAGLGSPHVVPIFDSGVIDGRFFIAMQLIAGTDLATILKRHGAMSPQWAVEVVGQAAAALDSAHAVGLVHRDIKPANLMMTDGGFVYLIDFGIARAPGELTLTATGATIGTLAYMAPERFTLGQADARSDIYALTCVLYECLTGVVPYPGGSVEQQMFAHISGPPPAPSRVPAGIPAALDAVIARGMAREPGQRYPSAGALAWAARAALNAPQSAGQTTHAAGVGVVSASGNVVPRWSDAPAPVSRSRRAPMVAAVAGICAAALVGAAILGYLHWTMPDRALEADSDVVVKTAVAMVVAAASLSPENPDASIEKAAGFMAPDRAEAFREGVGRAATDLAKRNVAVEAEPLSVGVEELSPATATVAVVLRNTQTVENQELKQVVVPVRVTLEKRGGQWLVLEMSPIHQR